MTLMEPIFNNENAKRITVTEGMNPRTLYEHQVEAMQKITEIDNMKDFKALVVLPTGGGKTLTAAYWLLKHAIDRKKKVLWIAHRHLLLEQAAEAFINNTYSDVLNFEASYTYRIISGIHDTPHHIKKDDNILIISRDSLARSYGNLGAWLKNEDVYLVIDEAHHATAKSYTKIINYVDNLASSAKLLGLTATPFRTSKKEQGALSKIFIDDIIYKIDLLTLITKGILSTPVPETCITNSGYGDDVAINALKEINNFDRLPKEIAEKIAKDSPRNNIIVKRYFENDNYKKYGQTLVFAVNRLHAICLKAIFDEYGKDKGIKSGIIVSTTQSGFVGMGEAEDSIIKQIEAYRRGDIQVLINVNILTEGTDLPKTQTVFLTRPTVSTSLMTQMVGRALRGEKAGGTKEAYIVSFIDNWNNKIAWVNPSVLFKDDNQITYKNKVQVKKILEEISIDNLAELVKLVDNTVDTSIYDNTEFIKRIPMGVYRLEYTNKFDVEFCRNILVYDSTKEPYDYLIVGLEEIFESFGVDGEEFLEDKVLEDILNFCKEAYFDNKLFPAVIDEDIKALLCYYAQKSVEPDYIEIDELERQKLDLSKIAQDIVDMNMRTVEQEAYINGLWDDNKSIIKMWYTKKNVFKEQLKTEIAKILNPDDYNIKPKVVAEVRTDVEEDEIEIKKLLANYLSKLKKEKADEEGLLSCTSCGYISDNAEEFTFNHRLVEGKDGKEMFFDLVCSDCHINE